MQDSIRQQVRSDKVQLWNPPYTPPEDGALARLAATYISRLAAEGGLHPIAEDEVLAALEELRKHAVAKLCAKTQVTLLGRVIGAPGGQKELRAEFDCSTRGAEVREWVRGRLQCGQLRVITGGKSLQDDNSLSEQGWQCDVARDGKPLKVMMFATGKLPPAGAEASTSATASAGPVATAETASVVTAAAAAEQGTVARIREAAEQLTAEGFGDFELTDASTGRLVPMADGARQALVVAIALHARGRAHLLEEGADAASNALEFLVEADHSFERCRAQGAQQLLNLLVNYGQLQLAAVAEGFGDFELSDASTGRLVPIPDGARQTLVVAIALHARGRAYLLEEGADAASNALEFLVEADHSFERCRAQGAELFLNQLANYGELQLDICWAYALLGDSDHLPDAEARLAKAESMISRQVDKNFLALAEVRADQGQTITPEAIPSVRLWLLRGIARRFRGDLGAATDLQRARVFLAALRVDDESVATLLSQGASRVQAVAALRRAQGNIDSAAASVRASTSQREKAAQYREKQRKFGNTKDGQYVDPDRVLQLTAMGIREELAVAAFKRTNNDINEALNVLQTVSEDELLGEGKPHKEDAAVVVDDIVVTQLMSITGLEKGPVEKALRKVGGSDVEAALVLLTTPLEAADPVIAKTEAADAVEATLADTSDGRPEDSDGRKWHVQLKGGAWKLFEPAVDFKGVAGEEVAYDVGHHRYRAVFTSASEGYQENLSSKARRLLQKRDPDAESAARERAMQEAREVVKREL
eukprot:CAMPEP_0198607214 /NCGR_PEP_ID=MMETSP1462-20131121/155284_1 /TAXON_ID=1333877 /ORGANISM="Brandtodinium nutriculum, Strain RCC3387" /LENGTH=764 /DNA_ID=CAMNT_0044339021 /DNA_START=84 /DNA_END=2375 /DNA_ORIENTATION=+